MAIFQYCIVDILRFYPRSYRLERSAFKADALHRLNSASHFFTFENGGEGSFSVER